MDIGLTRIAMAFLVSAVCIFTGASNAEAQSGLSHESAKKYVHGFGAKVDREAKTARLYGALPRACVENFRLEAETKLDSEGFVRFALIDTSGEGPSCLEKNQKDCPGADCVSFEKLAADSKTMTRFRDSVPLLDSEVARAKVGLVSAVPSAKDSRPQANQAPMEGTVPCADCRGPPSKTGLGEDAKTVAKLRDKMKSRDRDEDDEDRRSKRRKKSRDRDEDDEDEDEDSVRIARRRGSSGNSTQMAQYQMQQQQQQMMMQYQMQQYQMQQYQQQMMMQSMMGSTGSMGSSMGSSLFGGNSILGTGVFGSGSYGGLSAFGSLGSAYSNPFASMYGAGLYGSNLYGSNLYGSNLYGSNLYRGSAFGSAFGSSFGGTTLGSSGGIPVGSSYSTLGLFGR